MSSLQSQSESLGPKEHVLKYLEFCAEKSMDANYDLAFMIYHRALRDKLLKEFEDNVAIQQEG